MVDVVGSYEPLFVESQSSVASFANNSVLTLNASYTL